MKIKPSGVELLTEAELAVYGLREDKLGFEGKTNTNPSGSELLDDVDDNLG